MCGLCVGVLFVSLTTHHQVHFHCQMTLFHQSDPDWAAVEHIFSVLRICTIMTKENHIFWSVILHIALSQQHNRISQFSVLWWWSNPSLSPHIKWGDRSCIYCLVTVYLDDNSNSQCMCWVIPTGPTPLIPSSTKSVQNFLLTLWLMLLQKKSTNKWE